MTAQAIGTERRRDRGLRLLDQYELVLEAEGLEPNTRIAEFVEHCIAKGANNVLAVICTDEDKLAYDPTAQLHPYLKARLLQADHCIRHHHKEN